ncbi:MAG: NIPSNAP family protein [Alphaproteobacteria bacterium]|nr:NIPSNAP family protein [Alphaproteobacteria bacterium]
MAITIVSRWKGKLEDALPRAKEVAPLIKRHGATSVLLGYCHSGAFTGQISIVATFPDMATYGRAWQAISEDAHYQRILAEASNIAELQDRSVIVTQEL